MVEPFARVFGAFRPIQRQSAQWAFAGRTRGAAEGDDRKPQSLELPGGWVAKLTYRQWQFWDLAWDSMDERPAGTEQPGGGVAIAQIGDDELLIVGQRTRVRMEGGAALTTRAAGRWSASGTAIRSTAVAERPARPRPRTAAACAT
ncbi:DUF5597 domain-containing protein [Roseateles sp. P5_E8]